MLPMDSRDILFLYVQYNAFFMLPEVTLTIAVVMKYSRNSPCDRSPKRPALVMTTFVKPHLNSA